MEVNATQNIRPIEPFESQAANSDDKNLLENYDDSADEIAPQLI